MISICLPVYNYDITDLTDELLRQAKESNIDIEILVFDDFSISYYKKRNAAVSTLTNVSYLEFDQNLGRSKIRNRLADFAKGNWLLFMDCDVIPDSPQFLYNYNRAINEADVICGGIGYGPKPLNDKLLLRWKYGVRRESKNASRRQMSPHASFLSSNFMIKREVFHQIRFNEEISGYGHEDTLFGLDLKINNIPVYHINNPCIHLGIEPCFEYLAKTEKGIINLVRLLRIVPHQKKNLRRNIKLLRYYSFFRSIGLAYPLRWVFRVFNPIIRRLLCSTKPSIFLFDLYKMGLMAQVFNKPNLTEDTHVDFFNYMVAE
ncbi:MAG: glycosyltransferase [Tenuifilaceae bacterium]|nr:glycosyltransferase [Bacteroidales bacterium]MDI9516913.1 glycosyltransferase [Bacteroidota bacterium]NLH56594.1 glycosyltransferase family 2 protein [Rikenellaceae bacterium]OQC63156.1 MAG: Glycosyl transferase family 2 [Bacteroidetes bacterium ADurb.Bin008]HNV81224.1 glycosyltransferase [Tenuifilaceae bacterium]